MGENGLMLNKKNVKNHVPPEQPNPLKINLPPSLFVTLRFLGIKSGLVFP